MTQVPTDPERLAADREYQERLAAEIEHYAAEFSHEESRASLVQRVPPSWHAVEARANQRITSRNQGRGFEDEVVYRVESRGGGGRALSLGSGPGGVEIAIANRLAATGLDYEIQCFEVNPSLVDLGRERAESSGLAVHFAVRDCNAIALEREVYDVVLCHASLHHLINLEHIFEQIDGALRPGGVLVVNDIVTRNGYRMWDETHAVVEQLWRLLPERFRYNHTGYAELRLDEVHENRDYGGGGMECARSEDLLPLMRTCLTPLLEVPYFSLCRRFFDTMYGPNYDLDRPLDRSILDFIWQLDVHYLETGRLRPETLFGIYGKR